MAERRMFAKSVTTYEVLPELSHGAQALYFHLNMQADDDGLIPKVQPVLRMLRCNKRHLQELLDHGLILQLENQVTAITHWRVHNQIRKDRYKPTRFAVEFARLTVSDNGCYRLSAVSQNGNHPAPQDRIGKDRLGKDREEEDREDEATAVAPGLTSSSQIDFENFILELYSTHCGDFLPCEGLTEELKWKIRELARLGWDRQQLEDAFRRAGQQPFLAGRNKEGWRAGLDWLCVDENLKKVCADKYRSFQKPAQVQTYGCGQLGQAELEAIQKLLAEN